MYEALYIVMPDMSDDEIQTVAKTVETLVTENGGAIVRSEIWGKRKLAYKVKHQTEGCYVLLRFTAEPEFIEKLEAHFRLAEPIIRFLVSFFDEKTLRLEAEQQKRNEAEIRASANRHGDSDDRPRREGRGRSRDDDDDEDDDD